jgi:uncharacterized protein (TIGR02301 family)
MKCWRLLVATVFMLSVACHPLAAQTQPQQQPQAQPQNPADRDARPYDGQILRLAEILGALHYLRELCGQDEGQIWRDQMRELVNSEGGTALRKARLVENFNKGYRGYARTYRVCNRSAIIAINRFMEQGAAITNVLIQDNR